MGTKESIPRVYDSKVISLLAIFLAMVFALELYPIVGITDIPIPGISFTIDWTGIPLILVFLFFGPVLAFAGIGVMGIAIGYRNPIGAVFKVFAEFYKILGVTLVWIVIRNRDISFQRRVLLYTLAAALFCSLGMFLTNIPLLGILYGLQTETAVAISIVLIPWNVIQSVVNVLGGTFLFRIIPEDLKQSFICDHSGSEDQLMIDDE